MTKEQLLAEVDRLLQAGDEEALETFVLEHFKDLPRDAQGALLLSYYTDATNAKAADARISDLQEKALAALETLEEKKE